MRYDPHSCFKQTAFTWEVIKGRMPQRFPVFRLQRIYNWRRLLRFYNWKERMALGWDKEFSMKCTGKSLTCLGAFPYLLTCLRMSFTTINIPCFLAFRLWQMLYLLLGLLLLSLYPQLPCQSNSKQSFHFWPRQTSFRVSSLMSQV
jgi:hypothetical protein